MAELKMIIKACISLLNYKINLGDGYYVSLTNVFIFGMLGALILFIVFKLFR